MSEYRYDAYDLRISSDLELPLRGGPSGPVDVTIRAGEPLSGPGPALRADSDDVVAAMEIPGTGEYWYVVTTVGAGYLIRVRGLGSFTIDRELRAIAWAVVPGKQQLAAVMLVGTVLALLLVLRGSLVLHASAVAVAGGALAFTGQSGRGKSTVAALCAAAGAAVVSDDVLLVELDEDDRMPPVEATPGSCGCARKPGS